MRKILPQQKNQSRGIAQSWVSITPWSDYVRYREGEDVILLYASAVLFHFIPRRALSAADQADLRAVTRSIPRKAG